MRTISHASIRRALTLVIGLPLLAVGADAPAQVRAKVKNAAKVKSAARTRSGTRAKSAARTRSAAKVDQGARIKTSTFVDKTFGFTIAVPDFTKIPHGEQIQRLKVVGPMVGNFPPNLSVTILRKRVRRDQYLEQTKAAFAQMGLTLDSAKKVEVSGREAVRLEYHGKVKNRQLRFLGLAIFRQIDVLTATCTSGEENFKNTQQQCLDTLNSLQVDNTR